MSSPKDTISSANTYYNNQYRFDPGVMQGYQKIHQREMKDTIETKQQRLERHLETQFQLNQQVPGGKVVIIAMVGKYAILALVMPPVYLLYEGPRWILITIQPFVLIAFEKAGAFLLRISTFGVEFFTGLSKKLLFFKKPKDIAKEKIKHLTKAFIGRMSVLSQNVYKIFQPINQVAEQWKRFVPAFRLKRAELVHFMKILPRILMRKIEENKERVQNKAKELWARLAQVQIPFIAVKKVLNPVLHLFKNQSAKIIKPVLNAATWVLVTSKNTLQRLFEYSKTVAALIAMPLNLAIKTVEAPLKKAVTRIESGLKMVLNTQKELLVKLANVTTVTTIIPMQKGFIQIKTLSEQAGLSLIQKAKVVLNRLKKLQPIVARVIKTLWDEGKKHSKNGYAKFKKIAVSSTRKLAKGFVWGMKKLENIPSLLYAFCKKIKKWIVKLAKRSVRALRVTLAWTKIILRYSLAHLWD